MEMQSIVIFALIGAVCMFIITGGVISMTSETDPSPTNLASGAALGGVIGAAFSYVSSHADMLRGFSNESPDMKIGLPSF